MEMLLPRLLGCRATLLHSLRCCPQVSLLHTTSVFRKGPKPLDGENREFRKFMKAGVDADGNPLPIVNKERMFPRMYGVLMVNQDGSTYTARQRYPYRLVTMPLDLNTLTPEELAQRERAKMAAKARVYVEEEGMDQDEGMGQERYRDLI